MRSACDPHANRMKLQCPPLLSSPLLSTPPNPPPLNESVFDLEEKKRFSQKDFDERDLRKLTDARKKIELKLNNGWGYNLTDDQIFEEQCVLAGLRMQRAVEVSERALQWPVRTEQVVSA
jgi:hypothetical protein